MEGPFLAQHEIRLEVPWLQLRAYYGEHREMHLQALGEEWALEAAADRAAAPSFRAVTVSHRLHECTPFRLPLGKRVTFGQSGLREGVYSLYTKE